MKAEGKARTTVEISMGIGPHLRSALGDQGVTEVLCEVTRYAGDVATDLRLPTPRVEMRDLGAPPTELDVMINGVVCCVPFARHRGAVPAPSPRTLASRIARIIHANRELLVDARIAEAIRASRRSRQTELYIAGLSRAAFLAYLRLLLRGCFRLDRGDALNEPARPPLPRWTAQACYEEAVRPLATLRCLLWRPPGETHTSEVDEEPIDRLPDLMQEGLFYELGVRFPRVQLREDAALGKDEFRITINDLRLPRMTGLEESTFLVNETPEQLKLLDIEGRAAANPATGAPAAIVTGGTEVAKKARDAGLTTWGRAGYIILACSGELRRHAGAYIISEGVEHDLDSLTWYQDVVKSARGRFGISPIVQVLRGLAEEGISIRHLVGVLEAMLAVKSSVDVDFATHFVFYPYVTELYPAVLGEPHDLDATGYAECVRSQFKEYISYKCMRGQSTLNVYLLDPVIEARVAKSGTTPLTDEEKIGIRDAVRDEIGRLSATAQTPVILTTLEVRRRFRRLIEVEFPDLAVLAYQELSPSINSRPIARISLRSPALREPDPEPAGSAGQS